MEDRWTLLGWICDSLPTLGVISFAIGCLAWFGLLKYLDSAIGKGLAFVRSRLNLTGAEARKRFGRLSHGAILIGLVFIIGPLALPALLVFFQARWHPSQLIFHPEYGLYALSIPLLAGLSYWFIPVVKRGLIAFNRSNGAYLRVITWCYICMLTGLLAPFVVFRLFDYVLPIEFFLFILLQPVIALYAYAFGSLAVSLLYASLAAVWMTTWSAYHIVHALSRHPQGAIGTVGFVFGAAAFTQDYFGLCKLLIGGE